VSKRQGDPDNNTNSDIGLVNTDTAKGTVLTQFRADGKAVIFLAADVGKVTTPTLVIGGSADWNVPIINSEQLYQTLKHRGIDT
jgi:pimeloyl-ACP methyl ester carboxylesterase